MGLLISRLIVSAVIILFAYHALKQTWTKNVNPMNWIKKAAQDVVPEDKAADSKIAQRAYVSVSDAEISDLTGENAPTVAVTIKNTGVTPAYGLTWRATFAAREFPAIQEIVLDRTKVAPEIVLPPGEVLSYKWTFTDWKDEWSKRIAKGDAAIFAVGEIFYKDAFGNSHFTKYRLIHGGDSMVSPGKFGPAAEGNEAD